MGQVNGALDVFGGLAHLEILIRIIVQHIINKVGVVLGQGSGNVWLGGGVQAGGGRSVFGGGLGGGGRGGSGGGGVGQGGLQFGLQLRFGVVRR